MQDIKVSVIIPAYNCEATIARCLNAILNSSCQNLEIIVIDDGSTDKTTEILEWYQNSNKELKVIKTKNQGPAKARNLGMEYITGEYFIFADADDIMEAKALEKLIEVAEKMQADVVCGNYNRISEKKTEAVPMPVSEGLISPRNAWEDVMRYHKIKTSCMFGYLWNKLHRTSFFKERGLKLPEENPMNLEDNVFYLKVLSENPVFYISNIIVTNYDVTTTSLTRRYDKEYSNKSLETIRYVWEYFYEKGLHREYMDLIAPMVLRLYCFSLVKNGNYEKLTMKKMGDCSQSFKELEAFREVIDSNSCILALKTIQSPLQRVVYCSCVRLLRKDRENLFLAMLCTAYPVLRMYLKFTLR